MSRQDPRGAATGRDPSDGRTRPFAHRESARSVRPGEISDMSAVRRPAERVAVKLVHVGGELANVAARQVDDLERPRGDTEIRQPAPCSVVHERDRALVWGQRVAGDGPVTRQSSQRARGNIDRAKIRDPIARQVCGCAIGRRLRRGRRRELHDRFRFAHRWHRPRRLTTGDVRSGRCRLRVLFRFQLHDHGGAVAQPDRLNKAIAEGGERHIAHASRLGRVDTPQPQVRVRFITRVEHERAAVWRPLRICVRGVSRFQSPCIVPIRCADPDVASRVDDHRVGHPLRITQRIRNPPVVRRQCEMLYRAHLRDVVDVERPSSRRRGCHRK